MYKKKKNRGIYLELIETCEYITESKDENKIDRLIKRFKNKGLTLEEIKIGIELINKYLPKYIECDREGCYIINKEIRTYYKRTEESNENKEKENKKEKDRYSIKINEIDICVVEDNTLITV